MFAGGLVGSFLGILLRNWLAPHLAVGVGFFIGWLFAGLLFMRFPPSREWRFGRMMLGGAAGAVIAGTLTSFFK